MGRTILRVKPATAERDLVERLAGFVGVCPRASVFHTLEWNRIVERIFATDFTYLVVTDGEEILGAMPCHLVLRDMAGDVCYSPPRLFEVPYGGPLLSEPAGHSVAETLFRGAARLGHRAAVDVFSGPENSAWVMESGFSPRRFETAYVDLVPDIEAIWMKSLDANRRNMIRKAEKSGVEVRSWGLDGLREYMAMATDIAGRAGFGTQPAEYYAAVLEALAPSDKARLYLAHRGGRALAGGLFLRHRDFCYYWHGASAADAGNLGQGEMIQWEVIRWARSVGCSWYDLVGVEPDRLPGIARFKLGFTKRTVPFYHCHYRRLFDRVFLKARRIAIGGSAR
jgi:CelD/BcsL family acetyltransferase involved in cellulose biosynthesis